MADDIETISSSAPVEYEKPKPPSAGLTAAVYGAGLGAVFGPIGLAAGLTLGGLFGRRANKNYFAREAQNEANLRSEYNDLDEAANQALQGANENETWVINRARKMAAAGQAQLMAGDPNGRRLIDTANLMLNNVVLDRERQQDGEASAQAAFQRNLIGTAATNMRAEYSMSLSQHEAVSQQANAVLDLMRDKNVDPNKPFFKAKIAELLSTGVAAFYKDNPNTLDAISQGSQALGSMFGVVGKAGGELVSAITNGINSEDFVLTRADVNRVAYNMLQLSEQMTSARMARLGESAKQLNAFAKQTGAIPQDYSLGDYVTGGVKELRLTPIPNIPNEPRSTYIPDSPLAAPATRQLSAPAKPVPPITRYLQNLSKRAKEWERRLEADRARPTN